MILRLCPLLSAVILLTVDYLLNGTLSMENILKDVAVADALLLMAPWSAYAKKKKGESGTGLLSEEGVTYGKNARRHPYIWAGMAVVMGYVVASVSVHWTHINSIRGLGVAMLVILVALSQVHVLSQVHTGLSDVEILFDDMAPVWVLSHISQTTFNMCWLALVVLTLAVSWMDGVWGLLFGCIDMAALVGLFALLLFCMRRSRTPVLTKKEEDRIVSLIDARKSATMHLNPSKDEKDKALFSHIQEVMKTDRPWLDDTFHLKDMVKAVYSNRQAVSRVINDNAGMNFCRFVNSYRVEYAKQLIIRDPRLSVGDAAMMSGFHNEVSFTTAFRWCEDMTPNEWIKRQRHLSRISGGGQ